MMTISGRSKMIVWALISVSHDDHVLVSDCNTGQRPGNIDDNELKQTVRGEQG